MNALLKLKNGDVIAVTQDEAGGIVQALQSDASFITVQGALISAGSILGVFPNEMGQTHRLGQARCLHDGTVVELRGGRYIDTENPEAVLDHAYYPELARGELISRAQWEESVKAFPSEKRRERYKEILELNRSNSTKSYGKYLPQGND